MLPLVAPVTVPVTMETEPEEPVVPVPVLNTILPLAVDPVFAVEIVTAPDVLPLPLVIDTAPPTFELAVTWPACRASAPPTPESVVPTATLTAPGDTPPVTAPDVINTMPEEALSAVPDDNVIAPDAPPELTALAELIVIAPVVADELEPDRMLTAPPVWEAATAAPPWIVIPPPVASELEPATKLTAPPTDAAPPALPGVRMMAPEPPVVVVPVLSTRLPLVPVDTAFGDETEIEPVEPLALEPLRIETAPPYAPVEVARPACMTIAPPVCAPEPPLERFNAPPTPEEPKPTVMLMLPP